MADTAWAVEHNDGNSVPLDINPVPDTTGKSTVHVGFHLLSKLTARLQYVGALRGVAVVHVDLQVRHAILRGRVCAPIVAIYAYPIDCI